MTRPVAFALNVDSSTGGLAIAARIAAIADAAGREYAGVQDHPYDPGFVDTLTHLTWLAAHASRVHLFPDVADLPLRPPAVLARQAATIDVLSGNRFEFGLGAGGFHDAIAGMGGPRGLYPGRSGLVRRGTQPAANVAPGVTHARGKATWGVYPMPAGERAAYGQVSVATWEGEPR